MTKQSEEDPIVNHKVPTKCNKRSNSSYTNVEQNCINKGSIR